MNELVRFPDGPPEDILIYWEPEAKRWTIWFNKIPPMYADGEYNSFREKVFHYKMHREPCNACEERTRHGFDGLCPHHAQERARRTRPGME